MYDNQKTPSLKSAYISNIFIVPKKEWTFTTNKQSAKCEWIYWISSFQARKFVDLKDTYLSICMLPD